tara:strand:+ start:3560 stop:4615 length:1056 start_codon:yes stop_codon:yes gene_type:complete
MRDGLKNRVNGNQYYLEPNTLSQILSKEGIKKLTFNTRVVPDPNHCPPRGSCDGQSNALVFNLEKRNHYFAPFRQPLKGYRKTLQGCESINPNCILTTEIYKDTYTDCTGSLCSPMTYTSRPTSNKPGASQDRANSGISARAGRPLIRSGMQPNSSGQQNSAFNSPFTQAKSKRYSYSYRELLNNRRKVTYEKQLPTKLSNAALDYETSAYGGACNPIGGASLVTGCGSIKTIYKPNNNVFQVQGAVDSSDRITRLKLNTIRSGRRCGPSVEQACRGIYRTGNAQTAVDSILWPSPQNDYDKIKYKSKFNANHTEVNNPQDSALARVRGQSRQKKLKSKAYFLKNNSVCCN